MSNRNNNNNQYNNNNNYYYYYHSYRIAPPKLTWGICVRMLCVLRVHMYVCMLN